MTSAPARPPEQAPAHHQSQSQSQSRGGSTASGQQLMPESIPAIIAALTAVILGAFMAILDSTVVNVALPTFGRVFSTSLQSLQWIITGYMLAQAAVIPLS